MPGLSYQFSFLAKGGSENAKPLISLAYGKAKAGLQYEAVTGARPRGEAIQLFPTS